MNCMLVAIQRNSILFQVPSLHNLLQSDHESGFSRGKDFESHSGFNSVHNKTQFYVFKNNDLINMENISFVFFFPHISNLILRK